MAYSAGTAAGQAAFLAALETFAAAIGWTVEYSGAAPDVAADHQTTLSHVRDSTTYYYTLVSRVTASYHIIKYVPHRGYSSPLNFSGLTTGSPVYCPHERYTSICSLPKTASFEYFLFGDAQYIAAVFRMGSYHTHLQIGQADLLAGYTKGIMTLSAQNYFGFDYTSNSLSYRQCAAYVNDLRAVINDGSFLLRHNDTWAFGDAIYSIANGFNIGGAYKQYNTYFPTYYGYYPPADLPYNIASLFSPAYIYARDVTTTTKSNMVGAVPGVLQANMASKVSGDEVVIGSDTYKLFPFYTAALSPRGLAYKKAA